MPSPSQAEVRLIDSLVASYVTTRPLVQQFQTQLVGLLEASSELGRHVHSLRSRLKDPDHLRDKLFRQLSKAKQDGKRFNIDTTNLLTRINDLAGVRILHLHTRQIRNIDTILRAIFDEQRIELIEGPSARTWDDESRAFFKDCGIDTRDSPSLYTSVHYVVSSASRTTITCEIQVRTLMEEVWGEVDHSINYPQKTTSLACREQLKVLARVTSSATRLVDSIYMTIADSRGESTELPARVIDKTVVRPRRAKRKR